MAMHAFSGKSPTFALRISERIPKARKASAGDSLFRSGRGLAGDGDFDAVATAWHATGRFTVSPKEQTSCTGCSEALHNMI